MTALHRAVLDVLGAAGQSAVSCYEIASDLDSECEWLVTNGVLPADLVTRNREVALRPWKPVFTHGDQNSSPQGRLAIAADLPFSSERGWPVGRRSALVRGLPAGMRWNPIASPSLRGGRPEWVRRLVSDDLTPLLANSARLNPTIVFADGVCGSLMGTAGYQEIHTALAAFSCRCARVLLRCSGTVARMCGIVLDRIRLRTEALLESVVGGDLVVESRHFHIAARPVEPDCLLEGGVRLQPHRRIRGDRLVLQRREEPARGLFLGPPALPTCA
jgi:hypothetical protein